MTDIAIFDLDGTLLDSMSYWRGVHKQYIKENFGIIENEDISKVTMQQSDYDSACWIRDRYNLPLSYEEVDKGINNTMVKNYKNNVHIKSGMVELLERIKSLGIKMGIASSTEHSLIELALKAHGLDKYFDCVVSSYDVHVGKKKPDIYIRCAELLGSSVDKSIVFEDLPYGLISSKCVGAKTVGLYDDASVFLQDDLKAVSDVYVKDMDNKSIEEVIKLIEK